MAGYTCPMHAEVRIAEPIACPKCGMTLVPEGTRLALLKHMASRPLHLAAMIAVMVALMAGAMLLMR